jgi:hypothetical protein
MTTSEYLNTLGITVEQAHLFILANMYNVGVIYNAAKQFGVSNQMLAEIYGGVNEGDVKNFFDLHGFDGSMLNSFNDTSAQKMIDIINYVNAHMDTAAMSSQKAFEAAIVNAVTAVGVDDFYTKITPDELKKLGVEIGNPESSAVHTMDVIKYASLKMWAAVDMKEYNDMGNFFAKNKHAFEIHNADSVYENQQVRDGYIELYVDVYKDKATTAIGDVATVVEAINETYPSAQFIGIEMLP